MKIKKSITVALDENYGIHVRMAPKSFTDASEALTMLTEALAIIAVDEGVPVEKAQTVLKECYDLIKKGGNIVRENISNNSINAKQAFLALAKQKN